MKHDQCRSYCTGGDDIIDRSVYQMGRSLLLIQAYQKGNEGALGALLQHYRPRLERLIRVRMGVTLRSRVDPEDLVQDSLIKALRGFDRFDDLKSQEPAALMNWLAKVAENTILNAVQYQRAQKRDPAFEQPRLPTCESSSTVTQGGRLPVESDGPSRKAERSEKLRILDECVARLPKALYRVVDLREYCGGTWPWVAEHLGCTEDTARKRYDRAKAELRRELGRHGVRSSL